MFSRKLLLDVCIVVLLYVVVIEADQCDVTMVANLINCQQDYVIKVANLVAENKESYCGPLREWDTCRQQYSSTCSNNAYYTAYDSVYDAFKSQCSGSTVVQYSLWIMVAVLLGQMFV